MVLGSGIGYKLVNIPSFSEMVMIYSNKVVFDFV